MFPTAATTDCCLAVAAAVISHCPRDKCSARASPRVTQPGFGSASHPSSDGRTDGVHPSRNGRKWRRRRRRGRRRRGRRTIRKWHCHRSGCVVAVVVVHPLVLFFPSISLKIKRALAAPDDGPSGSKGFVCIHRYFQIVPGIPHGNRGQYRQQTQTDDMHAFLNAGEQHPPVSLVLLLLLSARSSHALLFAFLLLLARAVRSRAQEWGPCRLLEQLVVFGN